MLVISEGVLSDSELESDGQELDVIHRVTCGLCRSEAAR